VISGAEILLLAISNLFHDDRFMRSLPLNRELVFINIIYKQ